MMAALPALAANGRRDCGNSTLIAARNTDISGHPNCNTGYAHYNKRHEGSKANSKSTTLLLLMTLLGGFMIEKALRFS